MDFLTALQTLKHYAGFVCCCSDGDAMNSPLETMNATLIQFGTLSPCLNIQMTLQ
jgi:hypothetical protein